MNKKMAMTVLLIFLTLAFVQGASALPPPVNQFIGIYDANILNFNESMCRVCHTSSGTTSNSSGYTNSSIGGVETRHHNLLSEYKINPTNGQLFGCTDCHPVQDGNKVLYDHNCINCHNGTAFYANPTAIKVVRPHHVNTGYDDANIGQPAQNRQCNVCHGSFVDNYNDGHYRPSYPTTFDITPLASAKAVNTSTNKLWGGCLACHQRDYTASPQIYDSSDLHHAEVAFLTPGATCSWCHVTVSPGTPYFFGFVDLGNGNSILGVDFRNSTFEQSDFVNGFMEPGTTNITINGTGCEKCHSVASIHNIQYNYTATYGLQGFGHIGSNWDCNGCHASFVAGAAPMVGAIIPTLVSITPEVLVAGSASTVTIVGDNFVNDNYSSVVSVDNGTIYVPSSMTNSQIVVNIPMLSVGVHTVQIVKGDVKSKLTALIVVPAVTLSAATLNGATLTLAGVGLGNQPTTNAQQYITITHAGNVYYSDNVTSWNDAQIVTASSVVVAGDTVDVITANSGEANIVITQVIPTPTPSPTPSASPTATPTPTPSPTPSASPTATPIPTPAPTATPTPTPSPTPSASPTATPTPTPTPTPSPTPSASPTATPKPTPTPTPSITVTSPIGGENWKHGTSHTITWTSVGNPGANVKIELLKGTSASTIVNSVANNGKYTWNIPSGQARATNYKIRVTSTSKSSYTSTSKATFQIS